MFKERELEERISRLENKIELLTKENQKLLGKFNSFYNKVMPVIMRRVPMR